ncbi:hypothetical protein TEA_004349 [Camellia sinensis var. sinensis]|uniref:Beta-fructofuranosidase n=1 Tax=Camellia sinensis var. sinensis TaxID=542762 RepID=A0A4S4ETD4_CAMSN|nr:hypothetical protein TEA_004349 [Camellia sinensis var. sinensis]
MIYKGIYHIFYQYNPDGADWGNIVWAHSTSLDLVNWTPHPPAISPSQHGGDINGCWSGSTTILLDGKPVILHTGVDSQNRQVQVLAMPKNISDPLLIEWVKSPLNPLMAPTTMNKINASSFRDPTTAWLGPDGRWRVIIGSKINRRGLAILYTSKDFVHWIKSQHPLHFAENTGMWECPDFFPVSTDSQSGVDTSMVGLGIKDVLKLSLDETKHDYYTIGTYNRDKDIYIPDKGSVDNDSGLRYDYGKFYASKTFYDSVKQLRILWGWINESLPQPEYVKQGWSGVQAIPRRIWLDKSRKQLVQWPISEIEMLRTNQVYLPSTLLMKGGSTVEISSITAAQADVEISFEVLEIEKAEIIDPSWTNPQLLCRQMDASVEGGLGPFGLKVLASKDFIEHTSVFFRIFKAQNNKHVVLMCSDQSRSSLNQNTDKTTYGAFVEVDPTHEQLSLRSLIDHSIVESFGGEGKACITARVYPTLAIANWAHLYTFNNGRGSPRYRARKRGLEFGSNLKRKNEEEGEEEKEEEEEEEEKKEKQNWRGP